MKKNYSHITVILDRSGSMSNCHSDTIGGFNQFLNGQKEIEGEATLSLIQFDDQYDIVSDMIPIINVQDLSAHTYVPRGSTALLDAIGRTINDTEYKLSLIAEENKPEKVIFVIITDGEENASREFTSKSQITEMITRHTNEDHWEFIFIGANQDAIREGGSLGIRSSNAMTYDANLGTQAMYSSLTRGMTNYRTSADTGVEFFSDDDKKEQESISKKNNPDKAINTDGKNYDLTF